MHAGDGDAVFQAHQLGQHFRALNHGDVEAVGFGDFGILHGNRRTGHYNFGPRDVFSAMSFEDCSPESGEALVHGRTLQVRARNFVTEIEQHLGNATHADAADTYEMDALNYGEHKVTFLATDLRGFTRIKLSKPGFL